MNGVKEIQPAVYQRLWNSSKHATLVHAYLFEGEAGTGKKAMALELAQMRLCETPTEAGPCGTCAHCRRIANGEHPDVIVIAPDGQSIKVEQIRLIKTTLSTSGVESKQKVLILEDAEKMSVSAANSLLKFLEEPNGDMTMILLTSSKGRMLDTIISRCQTIHFAALNQEGQKAALEAQGMSPQRASFLLHLTPSLEKAVELSENQWFNEAKEICDKWVEYLQKRDPLAFIYVQKACVPFAKDKEQQRLFLEMVQVQLKLKLAKQMVKGTSNERVQYVENVTWLLEAQKKMASNVGFQNVCEQFAWKVLKKR